MEIRPVFQPEQKYTLKTKPIPKLIGRIKLANFMKLSEEKFCLFIKKVENNPLFKKLAYPKKKEEKVISYKRPYRADLSERFCELKEEIVPERSYFDIQPLLSNRREIIQIIQKLGIDKFKQYFLYNKLTMTDERMSTLCGLEIEAVKSINALMDELSIHSD